MVGGRTHIFPAEIAATLGAVHVADGVAAGDEHLVLRRANVNVDPRAVSREVRRMRGLRN